VISAILARAFRSARPAGARSGPGFGDHTYTDHASVLKFIEFNWEIPRLSARSRDNLPNPPAAAADPYVPANSPAIVDLTTLFNF